MSNPPRAKAHTYADYNSHHDTTTRTYLILCTTKADIMNVNAESRHTGLYSLVVTI